VSEEDVRGGLRDAVAEEPPLDFDADALVATARQQVSRRRALIGVGVATVAVAVAAVAVPAVFGRGAPVANRPASTTSTTTPGTTLTTTPVPSTSSAVPRQYTREELRRRSQQMASHLLRATPVALPEASAIDVGEFGGEAAGQFYDGQTYVNAPVSFTIDDARYSIFVTVWVPGVADPSPATVCAVACQALDDEDGGQVVATSDDLGEQRIQTVYHFRKDGGVVQIAGYNYDMAGDVPAMYMPAMPMTADQLKTLATDSELGL